MIHYFANKLLIHDTAPSLDVSRLGCI